MKWLALAAIGGGIAIAAPAEAACPTPNPNLHAPPFVNNCPLPAAPLNVISIANYRSPMQFGCAGNGTTDDRACVQAAINAIQGTGGWLLIEHMYFIGSPGLSVTMPLKITGAGPPMLGSPKYGFHMGPDSTVTLSPGASSSSITNIYFNNAITTLPILRNNSTGTTISNNLIQSACLGIDEDNGGNNIISFNLINNTAGSTFGCSGETAGIRIGNTQAAGIPTDDRILFNTVASSQGFPPTAGMLIKSAGGLLLEGNDVLYAQCGTSIKPGNNQAVAWLTANGTVLGDTDSAHDLCIDTGSANAVVSGALFTGSWSSNATGGASVFVRNTAGGIVNGLHFIGHRAFPNGTNNSVDIAGSGISNVTIDASQICYSNPAATGIAIGAGPAGVALLNNTIGICYNGALGRGTPGGTGVSINAGATMVQMVGNNYTQTTTPVTGSPTVSVGNMP